MNLMISCTDSRQQYETITGSYFLVVFYLSRVAANAFLVAVLLVISWLASTLEKYYREGAPPSPVIGLTKILLFKQKNVFQPPRR